LQDLQTLEPQVGEWYFLHPSHSDRNLPRWLPCGVGITVPRVTVPHCNFRFDTQLQKQHGWLSRSEIVCVESCRNNGMLLFVCLYTLGSVFCKSLFAVRLDFFMWLCVVTFVIGVLLTHAIPLVWGEGCQWCYRAGWGSPRDGKINMSNDKFCNFWKFIFPVMGVHYDYSPQAPKKT